MPSFYIHITVAEHVARRFGDADAWSDDRVPSPHLPGPSPRQLRALAEAHPNYYALGAVGPDLLFLLPDFRGSLFGRRLGNTLVGVASFVDDLMTNLDEWVLSYWDRYFGPHRHNVELAVSRLSGDMSTVAQDVLGSLIAIQIQAAASLASYTNDWFANFSLGHNKGYDNRDFLWSDMLHYRKTSQFGRALWQIAEEREGAGDADAKLWADRLRAYALGYITHIATDVTGHPFTNEKSGGPFRTHWQRHKVVENHMDARVYDSEHGVDPTWFELAGSALHYKIAFTPSGDAVTLPTVPPVEPTLRDLYVRRRQLDLSSELPLEVAQQLYEALGRTYVTGGTGPTDSSPNILGGDGRPSADALHDTYGVLFRYLQHTMLDGYWHAKPQPPELFPNLDFPLLTDPADDPPGEGDDDLDLLDILLSIVRFLLFLLDVVIWLFTLPAAVILDVLTYGPRNAAYYGIQLPLHYMMLGLRRLMVMTGYLVPRRVEISVNLTELGVGPRDQFLATLEAMDDVLGGLSGASLEDLAAGAEQLAQAEQVSVEEAASVVLGQASLDLRPPEEPSPDRDFPLRHEEGEHLHPWRYPQASGELDPTTAGPFERGDDVQELVDGAMPGHQGIRHKYERSPDPRTTDDISANEMTREINMGDPVNFSAYLMWQLTREGDLDPEVSRLADWNLDSDRGYAWKCWDWNRHPPGGRTFEDEEGNDVPWPCTPPSQFEDPATGAIVHDPNRPLEIHWADAEDPHCGGDDR